MLLALRLAALPSSSVHLLLCLSDQVRLHLPELGLSPTQFVFKPLNMQRELLDLPMQRGGPLLTPWVLFIRRLCIDRRISHGIANCLRDREAVAGVALSDLYVDTV